mgnify:CR=1 FL=1
MTQFTKTYNEESPFLTRDQLVERWQGAVNANTLRIWYHRGKGPKVHRIGKDFLYNISDVMVFESECKSSGKKIRDL